MRASRCCLFLLGLAASSVLGARAAELAELAPLTDADMPEEEVVEVKSEEQGVEENSDEQEVEMKSEDSEFFIPTSAQKASKLHLSPFVLYGLPLVLLGGLVALARGKYGMKKGKAEKVEDPQVTENQGLSFKGRISTLAEKLKDTVKLPTGEVKENMYLGEVLYEVSLSLKDAKTHTLEEVKNDLTHGHFDLGKTVYKHAMKLRTSDPTFDAKRPEESVEWSAPYAPDAQPPEFQPVLFEVKIKRLRGPK